MRDDAFGNEDKMIFEYFYGVFDASTVTTSTGNGDDELNYMLI